MEHEQYFEIINNNLYFIVLYKKTSLIVTILYLQIKWQ